MTVWTWTLIGLVAAGALLALIACAIALVAVVRLNRRVAQLRNSPFVTKLESLQIQVGRFSHIAGDAERLSSRAQLAVQSLRQAPKIAGLENVSAAWRDCVLQVKSIVAELS